MIGFDGRSILGPRLPAECFCTRVGCLKHWFVMWVGQLNLAKVHLSGSNMRNFGSLQVHRTGLATEAMEEASARQEQTPAGPVMLC